MANDRRILVIAGSDCSGGAGLEADQKVIAAFGCYAMTATTALTVQDTQGVYDIHEVPSSFVKRQIETCINDIGVDIVKIGMLASASTILAVADALKAHGQPITVIDPVMVSTSGTQLLPHVAVKELREHLLPLATILTPNIPEARLLVENDRGFEYPEPKTTDDLITLAKDVQQLGSKWVLLKGGHMPMIDGHLPIPAKTYEACIVINILCNETLFIPIESAYIQSTSTHGTGCSLASALASSLALGYEITEAVEIACRYVEQGIQTAIVRGKGNGPINHFHTMPAIKPPGKDYRQPD